VDEYTVAQQARMLLPLLKRGETPETIRDLIGLERPAVLFAFDRLLLKTKKGQRRRGLRRGALSPMLRAEILVFLKQGLTHAEIYKRVPVGFNHIGAVARQHKASTWRHGRGRKFSPELREKVFAAVKARRRAADIAREFSISEDYVSDLRHKFGDFENRRHWRLLTPEQVDAARTMLLSGATWRVTAANFNIGLSTLQKYLPGFRTGQKSGPRKSEADSLVRKVACQNIADRMWRQIEGNHGIGA